MESAEKKKPRIHKEIEVLTVFDWYSAEEEVNEPPLMALGYNILEAATSVTHQFTHHFFDCNS
jgi:hypothetical protein